MVAVVPLLNKENQQGQTLDMIYCITLFYIQCNAFGKELKVQRIVYFIMLEIIVI